MHVAGLGGCANYRRWPVVVIASRSPLDYVAIKPARVGASRGTGGVDTPAVRVSIRNSVFSYHPNLRCGLGSGDARDAEFQYTR